MDETLSEVDAQWLRRAFALAEAAVVAVDQAYGAVLVGRHGRLIAEAGQARERSSDPTAHAEMLALREASVSAGREAMMGGTLYSSTEPCPMCTGAIGWSWISRLVFGARQGRTYEFNPASAVPRWREPVDCRVLLSNLEPPFVVVGPCLEEEALHAHRAWLEANPASR
jgi:tRNA(Arg) A34 adenosine deaminase TadA